MRSLYEADIQCDSIKNMYKICCKPILSHLVVVVSVTRVIHNKIFLLTLQTAYVSVRVTYVTTQITETENVIVLRVIVLLDVFAKQNYFYDQTFMCTVIFWDTKPLIQRNISNMLFRYLYLHPLIYIIVVWYHVYISKDNKMLSYKLSILLCKCLVISTDTQTKWYHVYVSKCNIHNKILSYKLRICCANVW